MAAAHGRDWPVAKDGFRQRGMDVTRLESFTDAAFAFAITLLVISIDAVPTSYDELIASLGGVPAFAFSFLLVLLFWYGHWVWSRRFGIEDGPTILLSAALIFTVLIYVYPLKFMASALTTWLSRGRIAATRLDSFDQLYSIFLIYGIGFTVMAGTLVALNLYALRKREELALDELEVLLTRMEITAWGVVAGTGGFSCILAVTTPASPWALPGFAYWLIPVAMPLAMRAVGGRRRRELVKRLRAAPQAESASRG